MDSKAIISTESNLISTKSSNLSTKVVEIFKSSNNELERINQYNSILSKTSVRDAINETLLRELKLDNNVKVALLSYIITDFCSFYNVNKNMNEMQVNQYCWLVLEDSYLSLIDFGLAFKYAKLGKFGQVIFDRIDADILNKVIKCYEDGRADILAECRKYEYVSKNEKHEITEEAKKQFAEIKNQIPKEGPTPNTIYKKKALSTYDLQKAIKNHKSEKSKVDSWTANKVDCYYEHFERIGMINIPIDEKKQIFQNKIDLGMSKKDAKTECRKEALFNLFSKMLDSNVNDEVERYFNAFINKDK